MDILKTITFPFFYKNSGSQSLEMVQVRIPISVAGPYENLTRFPLSGGKPTKT